MTTSSIKNKGNIKQTKISFWINTSDLELIDKFSANYSLSRSDFIRLALREALVNRGLLPRETGSPILAK
jgi:metal-responsive CopG/Arc/MetJ family transcriptional regulator